jgi:hypothetical protein
MGSQERERRYDNVRIVNTADGTIIEGHDAVKTHFEREQKMLVEYGASIIFQVYRLNEQADTLKELQGKKFMEIKVDRNFVSGTDTVAIVKGKVRSLIEERTGMRSNDRGPAAVAIEPADRVTLYLGGRPMQDGTAFYADNPIILPVWVQVLLHRCESDEAVRLMNKLERRR